MQFKIDEAIAVLERTPLAVRELLNGLSEDWTASSGGNGEWQPFDIVGHLIHGEETDWIPRAKMILDQGEDPTFVPFDRFAQFENSKGKRLSDLLEEFAERRRESLSTLRSWNLTDEQLDLRGVHPEFGDVTLRALLASWVTHDLSHIRQIVTVMAKQYTNEVGPWREYMSILK